MYVCDGCAVDVGVHVDVHVCDACAVDVHVCGGCACGCGCG